MNKVEEKITCEQCGSSFHKEELTIICSNCFACTGCERYLCPVCDVAIVIAPVKPMCGLDGKRVE